MPDVWLGRWRIGGENWEGRGWHLAPCLVQLARQVNAIQPAGKPGDGTVASFGHDQTSPNSDHRPRPFSATSGAVVRAIDVGEALDADPIVGQLIASRDERIAYIIYEGRSMWSVPHNGFAPWVWQPYGGVNPHAGHFHLSTKRDFNIDDDVDVWQIGGHVAHPPSDFNDFINQHDSGEIPNWAPWDKYVAAGGSTNPASGSWPATRADISWFWDNFVRPLAVKVKALEDAGAGGGVSKAVFDAHKHPEGKTGTPTT